MYINKQYQAWKGHKLFKGKSLDTVDDLHKVIRSKSSDAEKGKLLQSYQALHYVLGKYKDPSLEVITEITKLAPNAVNERDTKGRSPLIIAVRQAVSDDILKRLIGANPAMLIKGDLNGNIPMHFLFSKVQKLNNSIDPTGFRGSTKDAQRILSLLIEDEKNLEGQLAAKNTSGNTPIHSAIVNLRKNIVKIKQEMYKQIEATKKGGIHRNSGILGKSKKKSVATANQQGNQKLFIGYINDEIKFTYAITKSLVDVCKKKNIYQTKIGMTKNVEGNLPLHTTMTLFNTILKEEDDIYENKQSVSIKENIEIIKKYNVEIYDSIYQTIYEMNKTAITVPNETRNNYPIHYVCDLPFLNNSIIQEMIDELYPTNICTDKDIANKDFAFPIHLAFTPPLLSRECSLHLLKKDYKGLEKPAFTGYKNQYWHVDRVDGEKLHKIYNSHPIHLACEFVSPSDLVTVLEEILKASISSFKHKKKWSPTAVYIVIERSLQIIGNNRDDMETYSKLISMLLLTDETFKNRLISHWKKKNKNFLEIVGSIEKDVDEENITVEQKIERYTRKIIQSSLIVKDYRTGNYPLHLACQETNSKMHLEHILRMIDVASSVGESQNEHGELPLHVATKNVASFFVIEALLNVYSANKVMKRDNDKKYPDVSIYFLHHGFPKEFVSSLYVFKHTLEDQLSISFDEIKKRNSAKNKATVSMYNIPGINKVMPKQVANKKQRRKSQINTKHKHAIHDMTRAFNSQMKLVTRTGKKGIAIELWENQHDKYARFQKEYPKLFHKLGDHHHDDGLAGMFTKYYNRHTKLFSGSYLRETCRIVFGGNALIDYDECNSRLRFFIYLKLLEETAAASNENLKSHEVPDRYIDKLNELMRLSEEEYTHRDINYATRRGLHRKACDMSLHLFVGTLNDGMTQQCKNHRKILNKAEILHFQKQTDTTLDSNVDKDAEKGNKTFDANAINHADSYLEIETRLNEEEKKIIFVSPLMHAVRMGSVEIVKILINDGSGTSSVEPSLYFPTSDSGHWCFKRCIPRWWYTNTHPISPYDLALFYLNEGLEQNREQEDQEYDQIVIENEDMRWTVEGWKNILDELQKSTGYTKYRIQLELTNWQKVRKFIFCTFLFLLLFLMGMVSLNNIDKAQSYDTFDLTVDSHEHLVREELSEELPLNYYDIATKNDFWDWVKGPMFGYLFPDKPKNEDRFNCTCKNKCHQTLGDSIVVGDILFRQVRKKIDKCQHWPRLFGDDIPVCVYNEFPEKKQKFSNICNSKCNMEEKSVKSSNNSLVGKNKNILWKIDKDKNYKLFNDDSYNIPIEFRDLQYSNKLLIPINSKEQFAAQIQKLIDNHWICSQCGTALISIVINVYNPHINRYIVMLHNVEFKISGAATPYVESMVLNGFLSPFATSQDRNAGTLVFILIVLLFLSKIYEELHDFHGTIVHPPYTMCCFARNTKNCMAKKWNKFYKYISSFWNFVELIHIYVFISFFISTMRAYGKGLGIKTEFNMAFEGKTGTAACKKTEETFVTLVEYGRLTDAAQSSLAFLFLLHSFHMLKMLSEVEIMGIGPNVLAIKNTIVSSHMWPFYMILLTLLFGLAMSSHVAFGNQVDSYHTFTKSGLNVFQLTFGDFDISFDSMMKSKEVFSMIFWILSAFAMTMVMMNVMIAVVSDVYQDSVRESKKDFVTESNVRLMKQLKNLKGADNSDVLKLIGDYLSVSKTLVDKDVNRLVRTLAKGHGKSLKESREETFRRVLGASKGNDFHSVMKYLRKLSVELGVELDEQGLEDEGDHMPDSESYSAKVQYDYLQHKKFHQRKIEDREKDSKEKLAQRRAAQKLNS